jgi:hypothetical protein
MPRRQPAARPRPDAHTFRENSSRFHQSREVRQGRSTAPCTPCLRAPRSRLPSAAPREKLHFPHDGTKFAGSFVSPSTTGTTWSTVVAGRPHHQQIRPLDAKTARRNARQPGPYGCAVTHPRMPPHFGAAKNADRPGSADHDRLLSAIRRRRSQGPILIVKDDQDRGPDQLMAWDRSSCSPSGPAPRVR